ncbi:MAG: type II toxin-antitoxin system VapC family toxin [bacterium]
MYLLDTNIISKATRKDPESIEIINNLRNKWMIHNQHLDLFTSVIVIQEIEFGILQAQLKHGKDYKKDYFTNQNAFISDKISVLDYTNEMAKRFAKIKSKLNSSGKNVGDADLMIAAAAIETNLVLITNNTKHFEVIPGLAIEDWTKPL